MTTAPATTRAGRRPRITGAARHRYDTTLIGRLNTEWATLKTGPTPPAWRHHAALNHPTLAHIETHTRTANAATANSTLHALLTQHHAQCDHLAARTLLQLMLGTAIRLAAAHTGRDSKEHLETTAVEALWHTIITYPLRRRPTKIAANITLDTLHSITTELAHTQHEMPSDPAVLDLPGYPSGTPADLELLDLLTWAVHNNTITPADATLVLDIYSPPPGEAGGKHAADRHGLSWPAARQRAHRAVRKIAQTVHADTL